MPQKKTSLVNAIHTVKSNCASLYNVLCGRTEPKVLEEMASNIHRGNPPANTSFSKTGFRRNPCWNRKTAYRTIPQGARLSAHQAVSDRGFINPQSTPSSNFRFTELYNQPNGLDKSASLVDCVLPRLISSDISAASAFDSHAPQTECGACSENGFRFEPVNVPPCYEEEFLSSYGANIMSSADEAICKKNAVQQEETVPAVELALEKAVCGEGNTRIHLEDISCSVLEEYDCYAPRNVNTSVEATMYSEFESCGNKLLKSLPCPEKDYIDRAGKERCNRFNEGENLFPFANSPELPLLQVDQRFNEGRDYWGTNDLLMRTECNRRYQSDSDCVGNIEDEFVTVQKEDRINNSGCRKYLTLSGEEVLTESTDGRDIISPIQTSETDYRSEQIEEGKKFIEGRNSVYDYQSESAAVGMDFRLSQRKESTQNTGADCGIRELEDTSPMKAELQYLTQQMVVTGFTNESVLSSEHSTSENSSDDLICSRLFRSLREFTECNQLECRKEITNASQRYCESTCSVNNSETQNLTRQKENDLQDNVMTESFPDLNTQVLDLRINKCRRTCDAHNRALDLRISTNNERHIDVMKSLHNSDTIEGSNLTECNRALCGRISILNSENITTTSWGEEPSQIVGEVGQFGSSYSVDNNTCWKTRSCDGSDSNQGKHIATPYSEESSLSNRKATARSLPQERPIPNSIHRKRREALTPCLTDPEDDFGCSNAQSCNSNWKAEE